MAEILTSSLRKISVHFRLEDGPDWLRCVFPFEAFLEPLCNLLKSTFRTHAGLCFLAG